MTRNQIEYQRNVEQKRANLRNEALTELRDAETKRSNTVREAETARSNRAQEGLQGARNAEQARSNLANEFIKTNELVEQTRHNVNSEILQGNQIAELSRSNLAREIETNRSNIAREAELNRSNLAQEANTASKINNEFILGEQSVEAQRYGINTQRDTADKDRVSRENIARKHESNENLRTLFRGVNETGNNVIRTLGGLGQSLIRGRLGGSR